MVRIAEGEHPKIVIKFMIFKFNPLLRYGKVITLQNPVSTVLGHKHREQCWIQLCIKCLIIDLVNYE